MQHIIIMAVTGLLLGIGAGFGIQAIAHKWYDTLRAAVYGCLLGIAVIICALIVGYYVYSGGITEGRIVCPK